MSGKKHVLYGSAMAMNCAFTTGVMAKDMNTYPDIVGKHLSIVEDSLEEQHIGTNIERVDSPSRRGHILKQIPPAGTPLGKTAKMYLLVSDGLVVPDLIGVQLVKAKKQLEKMGFSMETVRIDLQDKPNNESNSIKHPDKIYVEGSHLIKPEAIVYTTPIAGTRIDPESETVFIVTSKRIQIPPDLMEQHYYSLDLDKNPYINYVRYTIQECPPLKPEPGWCNICRYKIISSSSGPGEIVPLGSRVDIYDTWWVDSFYCRTFKPDTGSMKFEIPF